MYVLCDRASRRSPSPLRRGRTLVAADAAGRSAAQAVAFRTVR